MKDHYIKYAPLILVSFELIVWCITLYLSFIFHISGATLGLPFVLSQAIVNYLCGVLIKILYDQANKDSLTGICNRRYFANKMSSLSRTEFPISIMFLDIDNFKRVNDLYGHTAGDELLIKISNVLSEKVRKTDLVARWGGEEFAIVLYNTSHENAFILAERIRTYFEVNPFTIGSVAVSITVSIGISSAIFIGSIDNLLVRADKALYKAKETKNTVIIYNQ